ncbi:MAG: 3-deoxy-D-manno-octulosonic acid transferase [Paracoccaceae bacterium]
MKLREQARRLLGTPATAIAPPVRKKEPRSGVIWGHATSTERLEALAEIGSRLRARETTPLKLIVSQSADLDIQSCPDGVDELVQLPPNDNLAPARAFLNALDPELGIWTGGGMRPNLLKMAHDRGTEMILADILDDEIPEQRWKWVRDQTQTLIEVFSAVFTGSETAFERIKRGGYPTAHLTLSTSMQPTITPQPCNEDDLNELTGVLRGRPVWLAAKANAQEFDMILAAHRMAMRRLHRLLLIVAVANPLEADILKSKLSYHGLIGADWTAGQLPEETSQVLIACADEDLGLWYRVAPVTLMAESLARGMSGNSPLEALALGSVILFGPSVSAHKPIYDRLISAGAAAQVRGRDGLSAAVTRLSAPDKAAEMALAGWTLSTENAQLTDQIVHLIEERMHKKELRNARA